MQPLDVSAKLYLASNRLRRLYAVAYYAAATAAAPGRARSSLCDEAVALAKSAMYGPETSKVLRDRRMLLRSSLGIQAYPDYLMELADLCLSPEAIYTPLHQTVAALRDFYGAVGLDDGVLACLDLDGDHRTAPPEGVTVDAIAVAQSVCAGNWEEAPILADAIDDAGLSGELSDHLRSHEYHPDGCWVIDTILGRS
jgi:hypothetical protein